MFPTDATALQNGAQYEIALRKDDGTSLKILDQVGPFKYTLAVNSLGSFSLQLPATFDRRLLAYDNRVLFWRRAPGGVKRLEFEGLIRQREASTDEQGNTIRTVQGPSLEYLLSGRTVAYASGSAQADQSAVPADTLLVNLVSQNIGSSATDTRRQLSASYFTVRSAAGTAPVVTKSMSYRALLDVMKEVCASSRAAGTEVYFAMVPTGDSTFDFRTYLGQPGSDRTSSGPFFGLEYKNLSRPHLVENASSEINFGYGLGQGQGPNRRVKTAEDTTRSLRSVFGRREGTVNASNETTDNGVTAVAQSLITASRPLSSFTGKLLSLQGCVFGKDWFFGDRLKISYDGVQFSALLRAVTVSYDGNGAETLDTMLEAYL